MKRTVLVVMVFLMSVTLSLSQENDKIVVKGGFVQIDMKCTTSYRNLAASDIKREYIEIDKASLRKSSILSVIIKNNEVIITTSELISTGHSSNVSKHYAFKFSDFNLANKFYLNLMDKMATN